MKDQILQELNTVIGDTTVAFFSVTLTRQENGDIIPTILELGEMTDDLRQKMSLGLMDMATMISRRLPLPRNRLDTVTQVIRAYLLIQEEKDTGKLARWCSVLLGYEWPDDLPGKPEGFDELPDVIQGEPYEWRDYGSKAFYTSYMSELIIQKIGAKETLKYHHLHNLKRSRLQFEIWWLKRWLSGDWS